MKIPIAVLELFIATRDMQRDVATIEGQFVQILLDDATGISHYLQFYVGRFRWLPRLRRGFRPSRLLGLLVRISPGKLMSVSGECRVLYT